MWVHLEMGRHDIGKAVDGFAHVRVPASQIDMISNMLEAHSEGLEASAAGVLYTSDSQAKT